MRSVTGRVPNAAQARRALLRKTAELKPYFAASFAYVKSLKPKPTTRKKPG